MRKNFQKELDKSKILCYTEIRVILMEKVLALGYVILLFLSPYKIREHHQKKEIFLLILWSIAGLAVYVPLIWFIIRILLFLIFGYGAK